MARLDAVLFDMDGVLIDSEAVWLQVREEFAASLGESWTHADQTLTMGANTATWARIMVQRLHLRERHGLDESAVAAEVIRRMQDKYSAHLPEREGAIAAVHRAAARWPLALASGSPAALGEHVLRVTGLDRVFRATMYGDDVAQGKPAPDIWWAALERLGVAPEHAVGIEDSGNGVRSLQAAGMGIVAAPGPGFPLATEVLAMADAHIVDLNELDAALLEQAAHRAALRRA